MDKANITLQLENSTSSLPTDVVDPEWPDVVAAIDTLDGRRMTSLALTLSDWSYLGIGGGNEGQFIVFYASADDRFFSLIGDKHSTGSRVLVVGGQESDYPCRTVVDRPAAIAAARQFFDGNITDGLDDAQRWEKQG